MKTILCCRNLFLLLTLFGAMFSKAQVTIFQESFNTSFSSFPANWVAPNLGWVADTTNSSNGYSGASGLTNLVIRNTEASGTYTLISPSISTVGYENITFLWGARLTVNFPTNGSVVQAVDYSIDGGNTWVGLTYTENTNNSNWSLNNNGNRINLPSEVSNKSEVKFRWVVNIVNNTDGTYRIDDVSVMGSAIPNTISDIEQQNSIRIYVHQNQLQIHTEEKDMLMHGGVITLLDLNGNNVATYLVKEGHTSFSLPRLSSGIYIARFISSSKYISSKVIIN
jgi:hypothetical protein